VARIRTIKPEFFRHERLAELPPLCRLLFIGLWTLADRFGRLEDRPKRIKVEVLPYDSVDVDKLLAALAEAGFILRYRSGSTPYISIPAFEKHQRFTGKEATTPETIPAPETAETASVGTQRGNDGETTGKQSGNSGDHRNGIRSMEYGVGNGEGEGRAALRAVPPPSEIPVARDAWLSLAEVWNAKARTVEGWVTVNTGTLPTSSQGVLLKALRACPDIGMWEQRIAKAAASDWLTGRQPGRDGHPFVADLWWLIDNVAKLDAGRYDNRAKPQPAATGLDDPFWLPTKMRAELEANADRGIEPGPGAATGDYLSPDYRRELTERAAAARKKAAS